MTVQYLKLLLVQQTSSFTFTHQYLIQKSSFGKTCNAKKKDKLQFQSLSPPFYSKQSNLSIFSCNQFSERQTIGCHFCDEFWPAFDQVIFSDPVEDKELRRAVKTAMAIWDKSAWKVPALDHPNGKNPSISQDSAISNSSALVKLHFPKQRIQKMK